MNDLKKQLPKNLTMNIVSFIMNVFVGLWLVPYLVKYIGKAAYGLVPLAMVFTQYISVITIAINGTIARFITIEIQNNNWKRANFIFNTAWVALSVLVFIQIPILGYISFNINSIISIPDELIHDSVLLFGFTLSGYLFSLFSSVFNTSLYAYNRLDLSRMIDVSRTIIRLTSIVFFFTAFTPNLRYVGYANFMGGIFTFLFSYYYWRKLTPKLKIRYRYFRFNILKKIWGMGSWLIINQIGFLLFLKIDLFIINRYLGADAGGEYAAVQQWNLLIRTLAAVLGGVIGPMILISYAKSKMGDIVKFSKFGVKFLSIIIAILTGILSGFSKPLLNLWLGSEFEQFSFLLVIMLFHLTINLGVLPLFGIATAMNKVKIPGLVTLFSGLFNLILAILLVKYTNLGFYGVALAGAIALTLKNAIFTPWYTSKILKIENYFFFRFLVYGAIVFISTYVISMVTNNIFYIDSWGKLIILSATIFIILIILVIITSNKNERDFALSLIPFKFKN